MDDRVQGELGPGELDFEQVEWGLVGVGVAVAVAVAVVVAGWERSPR